MKRLLLAAALFAVQAGVSLAAPILIDNFTDPQFFGVGPGGSNPLTASQGIVTGANSIGGARNITITRTSGNSFDFISTGGIFELNLAAADAGSALVIWDGDTNNTINTTGLSVDLTDGGTNVAFQLFSRSDLVSPVTITVYSGANASSFTYNTPGLGFGLVPFTETFLYFSNFTTIAGTGADFTNVGAITLFIDSSALSRAGADTQIDLIGAVPVPEPSTMLLSGLAIAALGFVRRKRVANT